MSSNVNLTYENSNTGICRVKYIKTYSGIGGEKQITTHSGISSDTLFVQPSEFVTSRHEWHEKDNIDLGAISMIDLLDSIDKYHFRKRLPVHIYREENYFVAENEELGIWASGGTIEDAIEGFKIYFVDDYETYRRAKKLIKSAQIYYSNYRKYVS